MSVSKGDNTMTEAHFEPPPYGGPPSKHYSPQGYGAQYGGEQHGGFSGQLDDLDRDAVAPLPAPISPVSPRSVLAIGFITFLMLLSSLQNGMNAMIVAQPLRTGSSLLGGVTQALGRRRRSLASVIETKISSPAISTLHPLKL